MLPRGGRGELVTVISLFTVLSLFNSNLLQGPRILFSIGRDGLLTQSGGSVSAGGTHASHSPRPASWPRPGPERLVRQIVALYRGAVFAVLRFGVSAVFVLRHREPAAAALQGVWLPLLDSLVLVGSVAFLIGVWRIRAPGLSRRSSSRVVRRCICAWLTAGDCGWRWHRCRDQGGCPLNGLGFRRDALIRDLSLQPHSGLLGNG